MQKSQLFHKAPWHNASASRNIYIILFSTMQLCGSQRLSCPKCIILETMEVFCASLTEEIPSSGLKRLAEALYWLQHMT